jgi:1,4-alpha-glucan branching enzyme
MVPVRFELRGVSASRVCVAGSFNEWHPEVSEMLQVEPDCWVKDLTLPPGRHEYRFVVDGWWMSDPAAAENAPNPYGGVNSVIRVGANPPGEGTSPNSTQPRRTP